MEYLRQKVNASHAKTIIAYKNLKTKLMKCNTNVYFNKQCLDQKMIPTFARMEVPHVIKKEAERILKYKNLIIEIQCAWNVKVRVIRVVIRANRTISK
jgi:NADPH-dependent glutamate synthase beta subunit-like oxidoreductase